MKNIKSETKANVDQMKAELLRLNTKRAEWEGGAFKRSNEQLYAVLEECHKLLVQLRADVKLRKKLNAAIEANGYPVRSNTSIELKVVRAVFGIENNRIQAYTSVLLIAKKDMPKDWTLSEWIEEHGGIEEVRRKPKQGPTVSEKAKQNCELAEKIFADSEGISDRFDPADSLQPSNEGDYEYSVALVRINPNGKAVVVFGTNKNALVKAVLTEAGQKISDGVAEQKTVSKHSMKRNERDAVLAEDDSFLLAA
ncbi:hypothetical protein OAL97_04450 [Paracoccaceae bacterium]|nr:hypothetical protein [Paracoccaceae bacterium]